MFHIAKVTFESHFRKKLSSVIAALRLQHPADSDKSLVPCFSHLEILKLIY